VEGPDSPRLGDDDVGLPGPDLEQHAVVPDRRRLDGNEVVLREVPIATDEVVDDASIKGRSGLQRA